MPRTPAVRATRATSVIARRARRPRTSAARPASGLVPGAADGQEELRQRGIRLHLRAQPAHRDVDESRVAQEVIAPDAVEEDFPGEHLAWSLGQLHEEVELGPGQRDVLPVTAHRAAVDVDPERSQVDRLWL